MTTVATPRLDDLLSSLEKENPKPQPIRISEMLEYNRLSEIEKKKLGEDFWRQEHIVNYLEEKWKVDLDNAMTYDWLLIMREKTPREDTETLKRIGVKISQYAEFLWTKRKNIFPSLRRDCQKEIIGGVMEDPQAVAVANKFGGQVKDWQEKQEWEE
jgi:hypothetical protein